MLAEAVLLTGAPLRRDFGLLRFDAVSVDLPRDAGGDLTIPLLDTHRLKLLGHVRDVWVATSGMLTATLSFDDTVAGIAAYGMVEREECNGISIGINASEIVVLDADGVEVDPAKEPDRFTDPNLTFIIKRFELREVSVCTRPADPLAVVRAHGHEVREICRRMEQAQRSLKVDPVDGDDDSGEYRHIIVPDRRLILYGAPEPL